MEQHTIEQQIAQLKKITLEDGNVEYSQAQVQLGIIYYFDMHLWEQAESYFNKVGKEYDPQSYARAQFYLGLIYRYKKDNIKESESYFNKVEKEYDPQSYSRAQYQLGLVHLLYEENEDEKAESCFNNVEKSSDIESYTRAQYYLGFIYQALKNNIEQANQFFLNCCNSADDFIRNPSNCVLGDNVIFNKTTANLKPAVEYYRKVVYSNIRFKNYIIAQIMLAMLNNGNHSLFENIEQRNKLIINPICKIRELTKEIQKQLLVTFKLGEFKKDQQQQFERQVAHYTRAGVLFNLLKNEPSDFRLNVIDFMNDPTENQVLTSWLGIKTDPNNDIKSFLASFSFNHNSLNQFRLYGNENNIVGSSVSMAFNQQFFCENAERSINAEAINLLSEKIAIQKASNDFIANSDTAGSNDSINQNNTTSIYPLPLFRCLYFDPNSEYISIAKRSKFSFYLEHQGCSSAEIEAKWAEYIELLEEQNKIDAIRNLLNEIKVEIQKLKASEELKVFTNLDQLITLALMPISCLIKHAAFEDEDECRVIYITNIADEKIQAPTDYALANSLFVNYNKVEDFLEKIYLGPQCPPYHKLWITNHFRTSKSKTRSKAIKVVQSEMPLR